MPRTIRIISAKDVRALLSMPECIATMYNAFASLGRGEITIPHRTQVPMKKEGGIALFMPSHLADIKRVGVKALNVHKKNSTRGLPTNQAMMMIFDSETGSPLALMDGNSLTAMRTGAISGLATDLLARRESSTLALFGPGIQGATQIDAVCAVRDIKTIFIYGTGREKSESFAAQVRGRHGADVFVTDDKTQLLKADIICTATPSSTPLFDHAMIAPGTHINAVGAYTFQMCEISPETIFASKVVVDEMEAALSEAGELMQPIAAGHYDQGQIYAEIGEIVAGLKVGRENSEEITFFKSVGLAIQDLAAANLVLTKACTEGYGVEVEL